jgi:hypothetical protein
MDSDHIWARIKIGETPPGHVEAIPRDVKVTVKGVEKTLPGGFEIRPQRTSGEEEK